MHVSIKGALIGAIIPTIGAFAIFFLGDYTKQSSLERDTVQTLSEYFDSVNKDMSYEEALQAVYKEKENLKKSISDLNNQIIQLNNEIKDNKNFIEKQNSITEINKIIENATQYWNDSNYTQSLSLLKNSKDLSVDIEILYKQYSDNYVAILLEQTEGLIAKREYEDAISLLEDGKLLVSDSNLIDNKIAAITNKPSAILSNLTPVSGNIENTWNVGQKDNYGNSYTSGICLCQVRTNPAHVVYSLDGKYTLLTGKFVLDEKSKNTDGNYILYAYSLVNGDMTLIFQSPVLSTATRPIDIEIDVSNVMDLVIEVYDSNKFNNNAYVGVVDAKLE